MSNYNDNKKYGFKDASYSSIKSNKHKQKSPVEDDDIKSFVTRPVISRNFSPIGKQIEFTQAGQ